MTRLILSLIILLVGGGTASAQPTAAYENYLKRGSEAVEREDYETALLLFSKAQQIHDHPRVRLSIARIHANLGECAAAKANYVLLMEGAAVDDQIRRKAGQELAKIAGCEGPAEESVATTSGDLGDQPPPAEVATPPPEPSSPTGRHHRTLGKWLLGGGGVLMVSGGVLASGLLVKRSVRTCHGFGGTLDAQVEACEELAAEQEIDFWNAHIQARNTVQRQRVAAASLLAGGLVAAAVGAIVFVDAERRLAVGIRSDGRGLAATFIF